MASEEDQQQQQPAAVVETADANVDDLLKVTVDYGKLTFVLKDLLSRVGALEKGSDKPLATPTAEDAAPAKEETADEPKTTDGDDKLADVLDRLAKLEAAQRELADRLPKTGTSTEDDATPEAKAEEDAAPPSNANNTDALDALRRDLDTLRGELDDLKNRAPVAADTPPSADQGSNGVSPDDLAALKKLVDEDRAASKARDDELRGLIDALQNKERSDAPSDDAPVARAVDDADTSARLGALEQKVAGLDGVRDDIDALKKAIDGLGAPKAATPPASDDDDKRKDRDVPAVDPAELESLRKTVDDHTLNLSEINDLLAALRDAVDQNSSDLRQLSDVPQSIADLNAGASDAKQKLGALGDKVQVLESQLAAMLAGPAASADGSPSGVTEPQFNALRGTVDGLRQALEQLRKDMQAADEATDAAVKQLGDDTAKELKDVCGNVNDLAQRLAAVEKQLEDLSGTVVSMGPELLRLKEGQKELNDLKANRSEIPRGGSGVAKEVFDATIDDLRKRIAAKPDAVAASAGGGADAAEVKQLADRVAALEARPLGDSTTRAANDAGSSEVATEVARVASEALKSAKDNNQQIIEIRATIDHIHHTKADAALVANKAERDYVENALEKLMREVEQVMNSTNAGLIDTLDKSLGILRDMIDGKASKADLARLRAAGVGAGGEGEPGSVPEGLMGYRSYRCLGCNRTVDAMRSRPMGSNFSNFMNRIPASPRQPAPPRTAGGEPRAGYLTNGPST